MLFEMVFVFSLISYVLVVIFIRIVGGGFCKVFKIVVGLGEYLRCISCYYY